MGLNFGWRVNDVRGSYWIDDPDLENVSAQARDAWQEDGDASHLAPFVKPGGKPAKIAFRPLTLDESRAVQALAIALYENQVEAITRAYLLAFRIGVDFPDAPAKIQTKMDPRTGKVDSHDRVVREKGLRMLAEPFCWQLESDYPGIIAFYGRKIWEASTPQESEKKASSPPSTTPPSSETATTAPATESPERAA